MWCFNRTRDEGSISSESLNWLGPLAWPKYEDICRLPAVPNIEGVYLFTFEFSDGFVLYSVGISKSIISRLKQHSSSYKRGSYNVLNVDHAMKGKREEVWHGWSYARENQKEFKENKAKILKAVDDQLKSFRVFVAEVKDARKRERIEAALMYQIYQSKEPWSELADRGMFLKGRYNSEMPISLENLSTEVIYGLPRSIEI